MSKKSIIFYFLFATAIAGLIYQLYDIISLFFKYETVSELSIDVPTEILAPAMTLCFPVWEIINITKLTTEKKIIEQAESYGKKFRKETDPRDLDFLIKTVPLADMFKASPPPTGIIETCIYRKPYSYARYPGFSTVCDDVFVIERFFRMQVTTTNLLK